MTSGAIEIDCQPITPIWTGDADQKGAQLREAGLIGSLRWWYEAILRGVGFYACDPTSTGSCVYEESSNFASTCLACQLFGCTGYSRRFRVEIDSGGNSGELREVKLANPGNANHRGWWIPQEITKPFRLKIVPLFAVGFDSVVFGFTLRLIERFGALGAKTSHGQGVVRFDGIPPTLAFADWQATLTNQQHQESGQPIGAPNLGDIVGASIELAPEAHEWWKNIPLKMDGFRLSDKSNWIPSAPAVRAMLRTELRGSDPKNDPHRNDRHRLMGWVDPKGKQGAKGSNVFVSHLYREQGRWHMRIFGFVARSENGADHRVRQLLGDAAGDELKRNLAKALGLSEKSIVTIAPYPSKVEDFFS